MKNNGKNIKKGNVRKKKKIRKKNKYEIKKTKKTTNYNSLYKRILDECKK